MKVRNMESPKTGREVANQFIITDVEKNVTLFQSYTSPIIEIDRTNLVITVHSDYNYSRTTGKYRNKFMEDEGFYELSNIKDLEKYIKLGTYENFKVVKAF